MQDPTRPRTNIVRVTMIPPLIVEAHRLVTTTSKPIAEIAVLVGMKAPALEKRLERAYGARARGLRTGAPPTLGRPPSLREEWRVRLTAEERARVDAALVVGYAAGARSEGEALAAALRRVEEADPARAQASAEATLGRELAALRQKISAERTKWGEERAALEQKIAKQQATIGRLKAEAPANTKPGTVAARTNPHDLNPIDPRIAALEDHLARETRSSQALAARVKELEALLTILGVVPELPADGEPRFLPLAEVRCGVQVKHTAFFSALCNAEGIQ